MRVRSRLILNVTMGFIRTPLKFPADEISFLVIESILSATIMSLLEQVKILEPSDLAKLLVEKKLREEKEFLVVDVRGPDWDDGELIFNP
jgi:hypothetical protein